jgi:hypothetical protein
MLAPTVAIGAISDYAARLCGFASREKFSEKVLNSLAAFCYNGPIMDSTSWFNYGGAWMLDPPVDFP